MNASIQTLLSKIQTGLTLSEIENALFFILFVRFLILTIRYNPKTSFYITCIGLFAGYLWYKHLIDIILLYRNILFEVPFLSGLGIDAIQMRFGNRQITIDDLGMTVSNPATKYYIDPISMIISNFNEPYKSKILPLYYQMYSKVIPKLFSICKKFWTQISGIAAYVFITRVGKKYCPYLIRWHWTFLVILGLVEQIFISFVQRIIYFQTFILVPGVETFSNFKASSVNFVLTLLLLLHIGFIIFGLFHAIWGQYFYVPFFVENTELHVGFRPIRSIYSGGNTAWQNPDKKNDKGKKFMDYERKRPKKVMKKFIKRLFKRIKKIFRQS